MDVASTCAWFKDLWAFGNREEAKALATEFYQDCNPMLTEVLEGRTLPELVEMIDEYRAIGADQDATLVDMWILSHYAPQNITGELHVTLPSPRALLGVKHGHL